MAITQSKVKKGTRTRLQKKAITICLALLPLGPLTAQEQDFGGWYSLNISHKPLKWLEVGITPELRMFNNHSQVDTWLVEGDVSVKLHKYFQVGGLYRFAVDKTDPEQDERINRYAFFAKASYRIKPFDISYRSQIQEQYGNYNSSAKGHIATDVWRNKLTIKFSKKKYDFEPYASAEYFATLAPVWKEGQAKLRLAGGVDYEINKMFSASLGYLRQTEMNVANPTTANILTTALKIKLN